MRILDRSIYVGPSHYARFPVIRLELDLGELEAWPTGKLGRGFVNGLIEALPAVVQQAAELPDDQRQAFTPMLAILSAQHETQYSRLFRS